MYHAIGNQHQCTAMKYSTNESYHNHHWTAMKCTSDKGTQLDWDMWDLDMIEVRRSFVGYTHNLLLLLFQLCLWVFIEVNILCDIMFQFLLRALKKCLSSDSSHETVAQWGVTELYSYLLKYLQIIFIFFFALVMFFHRIYCVLSGSVLIQVL